MQVANTILAQFGGHRFLAMTGAKNCVASLDSLAFQLPARFARDGINHVTVRLAGDDTYTVTFGKRRGLDFREVASKAGVYADQLQAVFTATTGLDTHL